MTFTYEPVSSADKPWFDGLHLESVQGKTMFADRFTRWAVDRSRDAVLVSLGGGGGAGSDIPARYVLVWRSYRIGFDMFTEGSGNAQAGLVVHHRIQSLRIPEALRTHEGEVRQLVREALRAKYSDNGRIAVDDEDTNIASVVFY